MTASTSRTSLALVKRHLKALEEGDLDAWRETLAPDVVWHDAGRPYTGRENVVDHLRARIRRTGGTYRATTRDAAANAARAFVLAHATAAREGARLSADETLVFRVEDGRVAEVWEAPLEPAEWARFWG